MLITIVGIVCIFIGILLGNAVVRNSTKASAQPSAPQPLKAPSDTVIDQPVEEQSTSLQHPDDNDDVDELKSVLTKLFDTLATSIKDIQIDSGQYAENLEYQRMTLKKTLTLEDLKLLGDDLLTHVEEMHKSNTQYRTQLNSANALVKNQQSELAELQVKAGTDFLTNTNNRSALDDHLQVMINISRRYGNMFSLMVLDIDHFKRVNDTLGHLAGDSVLRDISKLLKSYSRDSDFLARYGGEEFVYILPEMTSEQALKMAEKLRTQIEKYEFTYGDEDISITLSGGISTIVPGEDDKNSIFKRADAALFKAKENGRNCIVVG